MAKYPTKLYEDINIGDTHETDSYFLGLDEVLEFANKYDPQPMHIDFEAAKDTIFGELVASGWNVLAITMRLMAKCNPLGETPLIGLHLSDSRFHTRIHPDCNLVVKAVVKDKRMSKSSNKRGYVNIFLETYDTDRDVLLLTQNWEIIVPTREGQET